MCLLATKTKWYFLIIFYIYYLVPIVAAISTEDFLNDSNSAVVQGVSMLITISFPNESIESGLSGGAIAGIVIAVIVVVLLLMAVIGVLGFIVTHSQKSEKG